MHITATSVVSDVDILFPRQTTQHLCFDTPEEVENIAFVGNTRLFGNDFDVARSVGLESQKDVFSVHSVASTLLAAQLNLATR